MGLVILQLALKITSCFYILNMSMFFIIMFVISETYHIYSYYLDYILYLYDRVNINIKGCLAVFVRFELLFLIFGSSMDIIILDKSNHVARIRSASTSWLRWCKWLAIIGSFFLGQVHDRIFVFCSRICTLHCWHHTLCIPRSPRLHDPQSIQPIHSPILSKIHHSPNIIKIFKFTIR